MKILLLFILLPIIAKTQQNKTIGLLALSDTSLKGEVFIESEISSYYGFDPYRKIESKYDTTVLSKPISKKDTCTSHNYVHQRQPLTQWITAEYNPLGKCYSANALCTKCYKHIHIQERRWFVEEKDEYAEAIKILEAYKKPTILDSMSYKMDKIEAIKREIERLNQK